MHCIRGVFCLFFQQRHGKNEAGGGGVALRLQGALVLGGDGGGNGQPKAEAALLPPGGIRPVKPFEQAPQLLRRNGVAGVGNRQPGLPVRLLQGQGDGARRRAVYG